MATAKLKRIDRVKGKIIHSQTKEVVANVKAFMEAESVAGNVTIPLKNYKERVLAATKISRTTYSRIVKERDSVVSGAASSFSSPGKKRKREHYKSDLKDAVRVEIRNIVQDFHIQRKRPTLKGILKKMKDRDLPFDGSIWTLRTILLKMGFRWQKMEDNRRTLMESHDIRCKRAQYLRQIDQFWNEGRPIVYTDETCVHTSHSIPMIWSMCEQAGKQTKESTRQLAKGKRLICVHAGGEMGFIPNALLLFRSGSKSGDYHDDINAKNYEQWLRTQLIPNLPPKSVLVVDNAPYHNVTTTNQPTSASSKGEMIQWLKDHNIPVEENLIKEEIYRIVEQHKPKYKIYVLDQILAQHGHSVLRLPPYHPELNPIKNIWAKINWVGSHNVDHRMGVLEELVREKLAAITIAEWVNVCQDVKKVEANFRTCEDVLDELTDQRLQFVVNSGSSDEEFFNSEEENEDVLPFSD